MAKISNTTVYPNVIPAADDFVVLTDVNDNDRTKTAKVSDFQSYFGTSSLEVTITSAQLLTSFTQPVVLLTCGANEFITVLNVVQKYNFVTTPYVFAGGSNMLITNNGSIATPNAQYELRSIDGLGVNEVASAVGPVKTVYPLPGGANSLTFQSSVANPTGGDGTLTLSILYRKVTI